jgi:hypothetical protein
MKNVEINETLWNEVSDTDKAQITETLRRNRLLMDGAKITGNPSIPPPDETVEGIFDFIPGRKTFCKLACDAASAGAVAATTALTGPGLAAALAVITVARKACRRAC